MRKIVFRLETGYCGGDTAELHEYHDNVTITELDQDVYQAAIEHAESMGVELCPDMEDCEDDTCEYEHPGCTNIEGYWEDYDPERHNPILPQGYLEGN